MCKKDMIQELEEDLIKISKFKDTLLPIEKTLQKIAFDKRLVEKKFKVFAVLDYADLFRYLHPMLDKAAYEKSETYLSEQLGLQYLFSRRPFQLYFPRLYLREYRWTIEGAANEIISYIESADNDIKMRIIKWDKKSANLLSKSGSFQDMVSGEQLREIAIEDQILLDLLFNNARTKMFSRGLEEYKRLVSEKNIIPALKDNDFDEIDYRPSPPKEYDEFLKVLRRSRPLRTLPNKTDAEAFHLVQSLNRTYFAKNKCFLFITSSRKLLDAFDTEQASKMLLDKSLLERMDGVTTIRDPQYFILRFILESAKGQDNIFQLDLFHGLVKRYIKVVEKLEDYLIFSQDELKISDSEILFDMSIANKIKNRLYPMIQYVNRFSVKEDSANSLYNTLTKRLTFPDLLEDKKLTFERFRKIINNALDKSDVLLKGLSENANLLKAAITDIELSCVDLFYDQEKSDFIYRLKVSINDKGDLQDKVDEILLELRKFNLDGVKEAIRRWGLLRTNYGDLFDVDLVAAKIYRSMRDYRVAIDFAKQAQRKAPESFETQFELCVCYRKLAMNRQDKQHLFISSWYHYKKAFQISPNDPRIMKEAAMLIWQGGFRSPKLWTLPSDFKDDPCDASINMCAKALEIIDKGYDDDILEINLMNDHSYYLTCRGTIGDLDIAISMICEVIDKRLPALLEMKRAIPTAAFYDTRGVAYMKKSKLTKDEKILIMAASDLEKAYSQDETNVLRIQHMIDCMRLMVGIKSAER